MENLKELYSQFMDGQVELDAFPEEIQEQMLLGTFDPENLSTEDKGTEEDESSAVPDSDGVTSSATDNPEDISEGVTEKATKPEIKDEDLNVKYKRKADEANSLRLRMESMKKKAAKDPTYAKSLLEEWGVDLEKLTDRNNGEPDMVSNDPVVRKLQEEQLELRRKLEAQSAAEAKADNVDDVFSQVESFQKDHPEFATSKDIKELDQEYYSIVERLRSKGVEDSALASYDSIAKSAKENGISLPDDWNTYTKIVTLNNRKSEGYPTLRAAYRDSEFFDEYISSKKSDMKIDKTDRVPTTLGQAEAGTPDANAGGVNVDEIVSWMESVDPVKLNNSPELQEKWDRYTAILDRMVL